MAFIKVQKVVKDSAGSVVSGSAAIVESVYVPGKQNHSRQRVRERLGKVIYLAEDKKSGIFLSPTRGLVQYNVLSDVFSSVESDAKLAKCSNFFPNPEIHTVFGDSYLLLKFLEKQGILAVLRTVFIKDELFERVLAHVLHGILKDGSKISCDDFIEKSFASYLLDNLATCSLHSDTASSRPWVMTRFDFRFSRILSSL